MSVNEPDVPEVEDCHWKLKPKPMEVPDNARVKLVVDVPVSGLAEIVPVEGVPVQGVAELPVTGML
jgi:hypothetical protein